jgi:hypothetical protein
LGLVEKASKDFKVEKIKNFVVRSKKKKKSLNLGVSDNCSAKKT